MSFSLTITPYCHPFRVPLNTAHGRWTHREGAIVTLTNRHGQQGQGEIAPLPWFGTETLEAAIAYCRALPAQISRDRLFQVPDHLPTCQFGLATALQDLEQPMAAIALQSQDVAHLIALNIDGVEQLQQLERQGANTFKCKIGVQDLDTELHLWQTLSNHAAPDTRFRLDANGGLTRETAHQWLQLAQQQGHVEFLEQPLPPNQFPAIQQLQQEFKVAIALDESVATFPDLQRCTAQGWRGIYVVKVAIAGYPQRLIDFCQTHRLDIVCSSVFETAIGRQAALRVARSLASQRALGFGVEQFFELPLPPIRKSLL